jgi:type IX secretion system PorP/SprF family membrane protein
MKNTITLIYLTIICAIGHAQDMSFSNLENAPLYYNPALTGVSPTSNRMAITYRNQWASVSGSAAYQTTLLSYDAQLNPNCRDNYWSIGGTFIHNKTGDLRWTTDNLTPSLSYRFQTSGRNKYTEVSYLTAGFAAHLIQHRFNTQWAQWGEQLQGGVFNPSINPNEPSFFPQIQPKKNRFDLSMGVFYYLQFNKNNFNSLSAGVSIQHLTRPNYAFTEKKQQVPHRIIMQLGFERELKNNHLTFTPDILATWQQGLWVVTFGTDFIMRLGGNKTEINHLRFGLKSRQTNDFPGDALIATLGFDQPAWGLSASFEMNTSNLNVASKSIGSFEIAGKYRFGSRQSTCSRSSQVKCPKKF